MSFDVANNALFFQDRQGNPFLAENDYLINCEQGCKLKSYHFKISDFDQENVKFGFQYGHRVEDKTHNWVIFRNFINLSFSYMTFVIKDNFDKLGFVVDDFVFDSEGYDYVLNKNTVFTEGSLVTQQFEKLQFILKNYLSLDPNLLESLHYSNEDGHAPIHLALQSKNNRMVNLILSYMAKIDYAAIPTIKDIFKDLISYQGFEQYLLEVPDQTVQMINKQTIMLRNKEENEIIAIQGSITSYVDEDYFAKVMHEDLEDQSNLTFAVKFTSIRADWLMNEDLGLQFLKEMLRQKRRDLFETPYIKMVTHYLYKNYSRKILILLLPCYVIHMIGIFTQLNLSETIRAYEFADRDVDISL